MKEWHLWSIRVRIYFSSQSLETADNEGRAPGLLNCDLVRDCMQRTKQFDIKLLMVLSVVLNNFSMCQNKCAKKNG